MISFLLFILTPIPFPNSLSGYHFLLFPIFFFFNYFLVCTIFLPLESSSTYFPLFISLILFYLSIFSLSSFIPSICYPIPHHVPSFFHSLSPPSQKQKNFKCFLFVSELYVGFRTQKLALFPFIKIN